MSFLFFLFPDTRVGLLYKIKTGWLGGEGVKRETGGKKVCCMVFFFFFFFVKGARGAWCIFGKGGRGGFSV